MAGASIGLSIIGAPLRWILASVAVGALFRVAKGMALKAAFFAGALSGLAFYGISSEWALLFGKHAYFALVLSLTAFWVFVVGLASLARTSWQVLLIGPAALVLAELARSRLPLGGYGLAMLSYTQIDGPFGSLASFFGSAGVSGIAAFGGTAFVIIGDSLWRRRQRVKNIDRVALAVTIPLLALPQIFLTQTGFMAGAAIGQGESAPIEAGEGGTLRVALVQAYPENRPLTSAEEDEGALLSWLEAASLEAAHLGPDLIVWPEGALGSAILGRGGIADQAVDAVTRATRASLLANGQPLTTNLERFVNRNYLFSPSGELVNVSDKEKLVPFGEYVPLRSLLAPRIGALSKVPLDGIPGNWSLFKVKGVAVGAVICFESTFSDIVRSKVRSGSQIIVVETNNRSFGYSTLSSQHLAASRMRAIENRRYVVHAALSGISAVIRPDGVVTQSAGLFERKVIVADIPPMNSATLYTRLGDAGPAALFSALLLFGLGMARRSRRAEG